MFPTPPVAKAPGVSEGENRVYGLGLTFRGLGFRGLGLRGLGVWALGFRC